jgi:hypothetical protein
MSWRLDMSDRMEVHYRRYHFDVTRDLFLIITAVEYFYFGPCRIEWKFIIGDGHFDVTRDLFLIITVVEYFHFGPCRFEWNFIMCMGDVHFDVTKAFFLQSQLWNIFILVHHVGLNQ